MMSELGTQPTNEVTEAEEVYMTPEEREAALTNANSHVDMGLAMKRLLASPDFQLVFEEKFIKDWALTQTKNVSTYHPQSRQGVIEQMLARSIFQKFCEEIIDNGNDAVVAIREIQQEIADEEEALRLENQGEQA